MISVNLIKGALAKSTTSCYNKTLSEYQSFLKQYHFSDTPNPGVLVLFIAHLHKMGLSASSIITKMSAISYFHHLKGCQDVVHSFLVQKALCGLRKLNPSSDNRLPLTLSNLRQMVLHTTHVTKSYYFSALLQSMLTLAFYGFLRPGEVTGHQHNLQMSNVSVIGNQITIKFLHFKHHQGKPVSILIPPQGQDVCPVRTLQSYLKERGTAPGPLFCHKNFDPISYNTFNVWFRQLLILCGIKGQLNLHSLRIGAATNASMRGVPSSKIKLMGRWKSSAYLRYIRIPKVIM